MAVSQSLSPTKPREVDVPDQGICSLIQVNQRAQVLTHRHVMTEA